MKYHKMLELMKEKQVFSGKLRKEGPLFRGGLKKRDQCIRKSSSPRGYSSSTIRFRVSGSVMPVFFRRMPP